MIFSQNNTSDFNTVSCELLLLRFGDTEYENDLKASQKVDIDVRQSPPNFFISGQVDSKDAEINLI